MTFFDRMVNLKLAAKCAMNVLFNGDCNSTATTAASTNVKIGIVPFTEFVNVGTGNANATWMDTTGASSIANDNFDDDSWDGNVFTGTVNRFTLYNQLSNVSWQGCVEARPFPYDTNDATPDPLVPDTLFVPELAPDNPDSGYSNDYLDDSPVACKAAPRYVWTRVKTKCNTNINGSGSSKDTQYNNMTCHGTGTTTDTYQTISPTGVVTAATSTRPATLDTDPGTNDDPGEFAYSNSYSSSSSGGGTYKWTVRQ
jgi:hypothetical protein